MAMTDKQSDASTRAKRANGEGGKPKLDPKTGLWFASIMVGYKPNGKPDRRRVKAKTQAACLAKLHTLKTDKGSGSLTVSGSGRETVALFLTRWLTAIEGTRRETTLYRYQVIVNTHLIPSLGRHRLADLKPQHLVGLYAEARKSGKRAKEKAGAAAANGGAPMAEVAGRSGLAPRTVKYLHTTLKLALDMAVRWNLIKSNPARAIDPPRVPKVKVKAMHPSEVAKLLEVASEAGDRLTALWTVAVYSGAREGELLALTWDDVDFEQGRVTIWRTLVGRNQDGSPRLNETKTDSGRRTITLDIDAMDALRAHRDRQQWDRQRLGDDYSDFDLVFSSQIGTALDASNVVHRFKRALRRAELSESYSPHSLRHANATLQLASGVATKVASERLGHSTVQITQDLYQHVIREMDASAASKIGDAMRTARQNAI